MSIIEDVLKYVLTPNKEGVVAYQIPKEFRKLLEIIKELNPKRFMEIGTAQGGSLYAWTQICDPNATIISIDKPNGEFGGGYDQQRKAVYEKFALPTQKLHLLQVDSHEDSTLQMVKSILGNEKLDVLFIDGDHTFNGVKQDFEMYSSFVRGNGLIVFHDITIHPSEINCKVQAYWESIKKQYEFQEIRGTPIVKRDLKIYGGIGILVKPREKVHIIMMCHNLNTPCKKELFKRSAFQVALLPYPKTIWYDKTCTEDDFDVGIKNGFTIEKNAPEMEWDKFRYAYDHTEADYIAICHADDIWIEGKIDAQLKYIENAAIVMTGYLVENHYTELPDHAMMWKTANHLRYPNIIQGAKQYGIVDCMPSSWMINKKKVPSIPDPFTETFAKDCAIVSTIAVKYGPAIAIKEPFVIYNEHEGNQWFESNNKRHEFALNCLAEAVGKLGQEVKIYYPTDAIPISETHTKPRSLINIFDRPQTILMIGWFAINKYGIPLAKCFENEGHTVIRVSTEDFPVDCDYYVRDMPNAIFFYTRQRYIPVKNIVQKYPKADMILLGQSTQVEFDLQDVYKPTYLYQSEPAYHFWPKHGEPCLIGLFTASQAIMNQCIIDHKPEMEFLRFCEVISWGVDPEVYMNRNEPRSIELGFQGSMEWKNAPLPHDYQMSTFYDKRNEILDYAKQELGLKINDRNWHPIQGHKEFVDFYNKVKFAVNVPGWENINERMYFVMAMGCVLFQFDNPELKSLGFGGFYNCIIFNSAEDLKHKLVWARDNPNTIEQILRYSQIFVRENTWNQRGLTMLSHIIKHQAYQASRLKFLEEHPL